MLKNRLLVCWIVIIACGGRLFLKGKEGESLVSYDPVVFRLLNPPGIRFVTNSHRTPHKHQPETMVAGVAVLDFNNDGLLDIYAVNGATMTGLEKTSEIYYNRLFKNNGNGRYEDVTEKAGVRGRGYNLGIAVGDYDKDLFAAFGDVMDPNGTFRERVSQHNGIFVNLKNGKFADAASEAGERQSRSNPDD